MRRPLEEAFAKKLQRRTTNSTIRKLSTRAPGSVDFSSNDFLSLAASAEYKEAFAIELERVAKQYGLASGGSRLLDGNSAYAELLESEIASFHQTEDALICNSGYDANVALFSCIPQPGDVIIYDELIHASVHDGMRASRAGECIPFLHNSVEDLESKLQRFGVNETGTNIFIAVESIYSMDGDVAPLKEIVETVESLLPSRNGYVIVDEAHATGIRGPNGRGMVCELGLERQVFARIHTFSKALACGGGEHPSGFSAVMTIGRLSPNLCSCYPFISHDQAVSDQLRSSHHIFHFHDFPIAGSHQDRIQPDA